jgi:hypothetical protein
VRSRPNPASPQRGAHCLSLTVGGAEARQVLVHDLYQRILAGHPAMSAGHTRRAPLGEIDQLVEPGIEAVTARGGQRAQALQGTWIHIGDWHRGLPSVGPLPDRSGFG